MSIMEQLESPSSRRAWIEILRGVRIVPSGEVALLAEGVDRNLIRIYLELRTCSRPPRGGRG